MLVEKKMKRILKYYYHEMINNNDLNSYSPKYMNMFYNFANENNERTWEQNLCFNMKKLYIFQSILGHSLTIYFMYIIHDYEI